MKLLSGLLTLALAAVLALAPAIAEARSSFGGFRGGSSFRSSSFSSRSFSRPSTTYSRPSTSYSRPSTTYRPAPVYSSPSYSSTTINQSSGGGFMSSLFGSIAGNVIAQWLFGEDEKPAPAAPAAVPAPAAPVAPVVPAVPAAPVTP
ncbi:hypothetical protein SAMN02927900_04770 [Rhizobium mongolense subsp. loessense]|uniref:Uncharacterized protein n=1 Tax=Rhizobium mongolense subsp. loessense TaxID=158890 RepID=A0A1G4T997_9HYPH|nr:hypothetical protein [Rhizobium mongolense]SCW77119.1 hypothetical protein SAMN02927900_04770 [Rhizobium mongolense subsp. loessense]